MKKYIVSDEYINQWSAVGSDFYNNPVVSYEELKDLAIAWNISIDELLKQVTELE